MTPEQESAARRFFEQAMAAGASDIGNWVRQRTDDRAVWDAVDRMTAVSHTIHDPTPPRTQSGAIDPYLGRKIGDFAIVRLLGAGGMGRVYEATGGDPPARVALKVMSRAAVDESTAKRFDRESRILARLNHPAIAALHGSGVVQDGATEVPWFAMELIEGGLTIIEYAEAQRLSTDERLSLFARACDGVAEAHAQGIVHRDLKPGNILVGRDGNPKVIDFGVARTGGDIAFATVRTDTGQLIGTMQYMSPEQFEADPRAIDARVDVYALGVVLFELLSGCFPYEVRGLPVHEAARVVCEGKTALLSEYLPKCSEELESIVRTAMARARHERYDDAGALARAVRALESPELSPSKARSRERTKATTQVTLPGKRLGMGARVALGLLAVAVVLGGLVAFGVIDIKALRERLAAARAPSEPAPRDPARDGVTEVAQVRSTPPGAEVFVNGKSVGLTPVTVTFRWMPDSKPAQVELRLDGHHPALVVVSPDPQLKRAKALAIDEVLEPESR